MSSDKQRIYYDPPKSMRAGSYYKIHTYQPTIQFKIKTQLSGKKNAFDMHNASPQKSSKYINSYSKTLKLDNIANINRQIVVNQLQKSLYKIRSNQYIMKNKWEDYQKIKSKNNIGNLDQYSQKDLRNCIQGMKTALNQYHEHICNISQYLHHQIEIYQQKYHQMLNHSNNNKSIDFKSSQKYIAASSNIQVVSQILFNQLKQQYFSKLKSNYKDLSVDYKKPSFALQIPQMCRQNSQHIKQQIQTIKKNLITIQQQCIGERIKSRTDKINDLLADIARNYTLAKIMKLQKEIEELKSTLQDQKQYSQIQKFQFDQFELKYQQKCKLYQQKRRLYKQDIQKKTEQIKELKKTKVQAIHNQKVKHQHQIQQFNTFGAGGRSKSFQIPRNRGGGRIEQPEDIDYYALLNHVDDDNHQQRLPNIQYYTRRIQQLQDTNRQLQQKIQQNRQKNRDDDLTLQQFIADLNRLCKLHIALMEKNNRKQIYLNKP